QLLKKNLIDLAKNGTAITSLIVSGHDGGGSVHGDMSGIDKSEILSSLSEAYGNNKKLLDQLQSLLLWGCYTSTPAEVLSWKEGLPGLKLISGFHGRGPGNDKQAAHTLLKDFLIKEKRLVTECN